MSNVHPIRTAEASNDLPYQAIEALVLSCIDYRLINNVADYLNSRGLRTRYDLFTLAGSAIGVMAETHSAWGSTFWDHVSLARRLHHISKVIVINHRDCAVCKEFIREDCADNRDIECAIHKKWLDMLSTELKKREPGLEVELLLMDLDGSIEHISTTHS